MKKPNKNNNRLLLVMMLLLPGYWLNAQSDSAAPAEEPPAAEEMITLKYHAQNNREQYLLLENYLKEGKKKTALKNKTFQLYLDSLAATHLMGKITTNENGKGKTVFPPALQGAWNNAATHKFLAVAAGKEGAAAAELEITRAKIEIDTASEEGARTITVKLMKMEGSDWVPVSDAEMKVGVQRLGGILPGGEEETYTTDSSGTVTVSFNKDSLPGDAKGNIVLAVRVDDNDAVGNLYAEKKVNWGKAITPGTDFFSQRTLWATRYRTPYWLLIMAYSIVLTVWGSLIYIVLQPVKIKKMGRIVG